MLASVGDMEDSPFILAMIPFCTLVLDGNTPEEVHPFPSFFIEYVLRCNFGVTGQEVSWHRLPRVTNTKPPGLLQVDLNAT